MAKKLEFNNVDLCNADDIYGACIDAPLYNKSGDGFSLQRALVKFRRQKKYSDGFKAIIDAVAEHFGCAAVFAIPGHTTAKTAVQEICGVTIRRNVDTLPRKYDYGLGVDCYGLDFSGIGDPRKVLLVDDVCVTGKTLNTVAKVLSVKGFEVVKFALGINEKLKPVACGSFPMRRDMLPPAENKTVDLIANAQTTVDVAVEKAAKMSNAERQRKHVAEANDIGEIPDVGNPERKEACRTDLVMFGTTYCAVLLKHRPSDVMIERYIRPLQSLIVNGGKMVVAMARGKGKTTWIKIAMLWMVLYGYKRFPVAIGANGKFAKKILADIWERLLCDSQALLDDFPEVAIVCRAVGQISQRCKSLTHNGANTRIRYGTDGIGLPYLIDEKTGETIRSATGAMMTSVGVGASIRGMVNGADRPDFILFDDIQKRTDSKSAARIQYLDSFVHADALGLGGADTMLSAVMPITPICPGDFAGLMLDEARHPEWSRVVIPYFLKWPRRMDLIEEFVSRYREDCACGDFQRTRSAEFYRDNAVEIRDGAEVVDPLDGGPGEVDAVHHALNLLAAIGKEAFEAEYQMNVSVQSSVVAVAADTIEKNITGVPECTLPPGTTAAVAFCDVNAGADRGMRCGIMAVGPRRIASIIHYFRYPARGRLYPENSTEDQISAAVARGILKVTEQVRMLQLKTADGKAAYVRAMCFDGGWETEAVARTVTTVNRVRTLSPGFPVIWSRGLGWSKFNLKYKRKNSAIGDHCYESAGGKNGAFLAFHADYWRELAQKSFLAPPLAPGSCSLFGSDHVRHYDFARECAAEKLTAKFVRPDSRLEWTWSKTGANHWGDVLVGCFVTASWFRLYADTTNLIDTVNIETYREMVQSSSAAPTAKAGTTAPKITKAVKRYKYRFKRR